MSDALLWIGLTIYGVLVLTFGPSVVFHVMLSQVWQATGGLQ